MTRDRILELLWSNGNRYCSGAELASALGLSRAAVWKAVEGLRAEGYRIEALPNRGYRLLPDSDVLSEAGIRRYLRSEGLRLRCYEEIDSTNTALKALANGGEAEGLALVAGRQSAGRGRMGRSFYSPGDTGVYLSLLLRPALPAAEAVCLTACAAVAVAETLETLSGREAGIKWVNDVFMDGKKVCGILTEASLDCESGLLNYAVVGVGVNALLPAGGFPEELERVAGAVFPARTLPELRCQIAAGVLDRLWTLCGEPGSESCWKKYRDRSLVLGREVELLSPGRAPEEATVLALERDYSLRVGLADGGERRIQSGEVRIRPRKTESGSWQNDGNRVY